MPELPPQRFDCMSRDKLRLWQKRFIDEAPDVSFLGWDPKVCKILGIGWTGGETKRFVIPIWQDGVLEQVWKYKPKAAQDDKYAGTKKNAQRAHFPDDRFLRDMSGRDLYISEGFGDCIFLLSKGIACCTCGGKNHFSFEATRRIFTHNWGMVYLVPDRDKSGEILGSHLSKWAATLRRDTQWLDIPQPHNDVTDALLAGCRIEDFKPKTFKKEEEKSTEGAREVKLGELHGITPGECVAMEVTVSGKFEAPYRVPERFIISCKQSSETVCNTCDYHNGAVIEIPQKDLIGFVGVAKERLESRIMKLFKPNRCPGCKIKINPKDFMFIEEARIKHKVGEVSVLQKNVDRKCFCYGVDLKVNDMYLLTGEVASHPETQELCFVARSNRHVNLDAHREISCPVLPYTDIDALIADISYNITHIYNRPLLHKAALLTLFSPMVCYYQGVRQRLYMESLLIGDTQTGKSQIVDELFNFFQIGQKVDTAKVSVAGLLGGIDENDRGRRFIAPGILSQQDGGVVFIEEWGNMDPAVTKAIREVRSSGIVSIGMIKKTYEAAHARIIGTGNPASGRRTISGYNQGIEAIFSFITDPADIRRFDFVVVTADDLAKNKQARNEQPVIKHLYTKEVARKHLSWVWGLKMEDVIISKEAELTIEETHNPVGILGHNSLPILTRTGAKEKIIKIGAAFAAITGSCAADKRKLLVKAQHICDACNLLTTEYLNDPGNYFEYCKERKMEDVIGDAQSVLDVFGTMNNPQQLARKFKITTSFFNMTDLRQHVELESSDRLKTDMFISTLYHNNCLKRIGKGTIVKTPAFVQWLKNNMSKLKKEKIKRGVDYGLL